MDWTHHLLCIGEILQGNPWHRLVMVKLIPTSGPSSSVQRVNSERSPTTQLLAQFERLRFTTASVINRAAEIGQLVQLRWSMSCIQQCTCIYTRIQIFFTYIYGCVSPVPLAVHISLRLSWMAGGGLPVTAAPTPVSHQRSTKVIILIQGSPAL